MSSAAGLSRLRAYVELGKLRLSSLAVFAVLAGLFLGSPELPGWGLTVGTLIGTVCVAIGGSALNMYMERDTDTHMERTGTRPLPTGRLRPKEVQVFGIVASVVGVGLLYLTTNLYATALCAAICVTYVWIYTPMKRRSTLNTLVGAVPGALPPVVGYAAGAGHLDGRAVVLFLIVFFWQIPHFLAIAWRYRDQYRQAGLQMLPVVDPDGRQTGAQMMIYCVSLVLVSLLPSSPLPLFSMTGQLYLYVAVLLGAVFLVATFVAAILRRQTAMRLCFVVSIIYLPLLLIAMVFDKLLMSAAI